MESFREQPIRLSQERGKELFGKIRGSLESQDVQKGAQGDVPEKPAVEEPPTTKKKVVPPKGPITHAGAFDEWQRTQELLEEEKDA